MLGPECDTSGGILGSSKPGLEVQFQVADGVHNEFEASEGPNRSAVICGQDSRRFTRGKIVFDVKFLRESCVTDISIRINFVRGALNGVLVL